VNSARTCSDLSSFASLFDLSKPERRPIEVVRYKYISELFSFIIFVKQGTIVEADTCCQS
jgi:hypothetical protein